MMKAVASVTQAPRHPDVVSLNPIMVDGTGMCGGCRVTVGGKTQFACVDGPEFDGHAGGFRRADGPPARLQAARGRRLQAASSHRRNDRRLPIEERVNEQVSGSRGTPAARHYPQHIEEAVGRRRCLQTVAERSSTAQLRRGRPGLHAGAGAGRGRALPRCKKPDLRGGLPGRDRHPAASSAPSQQGDFAAAPRIAQGEEQPAGHLRARLPAGKPVRGALRPGARRSSPVAIGRLERFVADWERAHRPTRCPPTSTPTGKKVAVIGCGPGRADLRRRPGQLGHEVTIFEAFHEHRRRARLRHPRVPPAQGDRPAAKSNTSRAWAWRSNCNMVIGKVRHRRRAAARRLRGRLRRHRRRAARRSWTSRREPERRLLRQRVPHARQPDEGLPLRRVRHAGRARRSGWPWSAAATSPWTRRAPPCAWAPRGHHRLPPQPAEMPARARGGRSTPRRRARFQLLTAPVRVLGDDKGRVAGDGVHPMELGEPDASGRRRPVKVPGSEFRLDCDMVIPALGTDANPLLTDNTTGLSNKWGNIVPTPRPAPPTSRASSPAATSSPARPPSSRPWARESGPPGPSTNTFQGKLPNLKPFHP